MAFMETYYCNDCEIEFGISTSSWETPSCPLCNDHGSVEETTDSMKYLKRKVEELNKAFDFVDKNITAIISTMNHQDMTDLQRGQINGLASALEIVRKAKKGARTDYEG